MSEGEDRESLTYVSPKYLPHLFIFDEIVRACILGGVLYAIEHIRHHTTRHDTEDFQQSTPRLMQT